MIVRKFVVADMKEGMETVRREMGREAMILSQRPVRGRGPGGWLKKKRIEVFAAAEKEDAPPKAPREPATANQPQAMQQKIDELSGLIDSLQKQQSDASQPAAQSARRTLSPLEQIRAESLQSAQQEKENALPYDARPPSEPPASEPVPSEPAPQAPAQDEELSAKIAAMKKEGVHPQVAEAFLERTTRILQRYPESPRQVLQDLISETIGSEKGLSPRKYQQTRVLVLGPAGVGKTTTLIKLASEFCQKKGFKVGLISADYQRAGAHLQLKAYAQILRQPLVCLQNLSQAEKALKTLSDCDLILIDTPGCSPAFAEQVSLSRQLLEVFDPDEVFLCLAASSDYAASEKVLGLYRSLGPFRLIVTKVDEISRSGPLLNLSFLSDRPIAYLTDGQAVTGHLHRPDAAAIAKQITR